MCCSSVNSSEQQKVKIIMQQTEYVFRRQNCVTFSSEGTQISKAFKDLREPGRERASERVHVCVYVCSQGGG